MDTLAQMQCARSAGEAPLSGAQVVPLHRAMPDWHVVTADGICSLQRDFACDAFEEALTFTDQVGAVAEAELHLPAIVTEWGHVRVSWWTHSLNGLHRNDFIMAARTDLLYAQLRAPSRVTGIY
jgi:4a-hydroxytetrahydrobiopterin dehydratase